MADINYKVLPVGEGKTRWLVSKAFEEAQMGHHVVLLSHRPSEYEKFLAYYRSEYGAGCPVQYANDMAVIPFDAVVLIDDCDKKKKHQLFDLEFLKEKCKKIFATMSNNV